MGSCRSCEECARLGQIKIQVGLGAESDSLDNADQLVYSIIPQMCQARKTKYVILTSDAGEENASPICP